MALVKESALMKRNLLFITISIAVIGAISVFCLIEHEAFPCEKVVGFTYSRTQPCNVEYYNYGFSVGPLTDLIQCWNRDRDVSCHDFRDMLKTWIRTHPADKTIMLSDKEIDGLCRNVNIVQIRNGKRMHPIMCEIRIRCNTPEVLRLLTSAYKECMLAFVERENTISSERATMKEIGAFQRQEREVMKLKKKLSGQVLNANEAEQLGKAISEAELVADRLRSKWMEAMKSYRKKWDASLVFLESPKDSE